MRYKRYFVILCLLLVSGSTFAQTQQERLTRHVYTLAGDSLRGRKAGSEDAAKAAAYIVAQFEEIGIQPFMTRVGTNLSNGAVKPTRT